MFYNRVLSEVRKEMKNQNNIIILLSFLMILLLIPTVCASDSNDTADCISLSASGDAQLSVELFSGDDSAVEKNSNSPLSLPINNKSASNDSVISAANSNVLSANPDGTFADLAGLIAGTNWGGVIVLDRNYVNTDNYGQIVIPKYMTIDGNGHTIDALGKSRIFVTQADTFKNNLNLKNIVFKNGYHASSWGGAIQFANQLNNLLIENCTFINCTSAKSNGAAVVFTKPVTNSRISATFIGNKAPNGLGALAFGSSATVDGCEFDLTFINNTALQAAAANFGTTVSNSQLTLNLNGNVADKYGGGVYFQNRVSNVNISGNFVNNIAGSKGDGSGGALYFRALASNVNIDGTFKGNRGKTRYAGAIYSDGGMDNVNINGYFEDNVANFEGGAIYAKNNVNNLHITGTFINNHADGNGGGAIDLGNKVYSTTIDGTFTDNSAKAGGAVRLYGSASGNTIKGTFTNNAAKYGGAIYTDNANSMNIAGSFTANSADYGGAIYAIESDVKVEDSKFRENKAINGSAIYNDVGTLAVDATTFTQNQAYSYRLPIYYNSTHAYAVLYGGDNIVNAIYNTGSSSNVKVDGVAVVNGAERSQGGTKVYQDSREANQIIKVSVYDIQKDSTATVEGVSDIYGKVTIPYVLKDDEWYIIMAEHPEDAYYTQIANSTGVHVNPGLNLLNHTMCEGNQSSQKLISALFDDDLSYIPNARTINYYVLVDGSYQFLGSSNTNNMGVSSILESSVLKTLKAGNYTLYANYTNDDKKYALCDATANLEVLPLYYHVTKTLVNTQDIHLGDEIYFNITFYNDGDVEITKLYAWDEYPQAIEFLVTTQFPGWHIEDGMWVMDTPLAAHSKVSVTLPFKAVQIGSYTNKVEMYANSLAFSNSSQTDFTILPSPDMTVSKSLETKGTIYDNTQIVFEVFVKNTGDVDLENVYLIDYENINGLVFDHHYSDSNCWSVTKMGDGTIKFSLNHELAINETHGIELYYNATKEGNFTNKVYALCEYPQVNVTDSQDVEVIKYLPNLTVEKVDRTAETKYVGDQIVYHISVENTGNAILNDVYFIEDAYTDGLVYDNFVSIQGTWTVTKIDSKRYKFTLAQAAEIGFEYSAYLYYNITKEGIQNNTVVAGYNNTIDVAEATYSVNVLPFLPEVSMEKDRISNWEVLPNSLVRFLVEVTNTGNTDLKHFYFVEDEFSEGLVYVTSNRNQSWTVTTVDGKRAFVLDHAFEMEETVAIEVVFNATTLGNKTNKVVAYFSNSSDLSNPEVLGQASDWVYVNETVSPYPEGTNHNITLAKHLITHGDIYVGDTVQYEIVAHNTGDVTITDLVVIDHEYPADKLEFSYWDNSSYWIVTQEDAKLTLQYNHSIPINDYAIIRLYFKTIKDGNISNTAKASWNVGRNTTTVSTPDKEVLPYSPDIHVTKVVNTTHAYVGDDVTYEVIIKNTGNTPIRHLSFDESDLGISRFNDYFSHDEWIYNDTANSFTFNRPLGLNESTVIALYYTVTDAGSVINNVTVEFNENTTDASSKNLTTEFRNPQMTVEKIALKATTTVGEQIIFEVIIHNTGNVDLNDIFILDEEYTSGLVYDSHRGDFHWDYDAATHKFTTQKTLLQDENATLHIVFNATQRGIQTNNASAGYDGDVIMGSDGASVKVLSKDPEITLEKVTLTNNTNIGEDILFQINIKNVGDYNIHDLTIAENYTDGLKYVEMVGTSAWTHKVESGKDVFKYVRVLNINETLSLTLKFTSEVGGTFDNTATAFEGDFTLADASNSTFVRHNSIVNPTNVSVIYTQQISVPINVTDELGNLLSDGTATLTVEGTPYNVKITNGIATFKDVKVSKPGVYEGTIEYSGYGVYNPSANNVTLTVAKLNTTTVSQDIIVDVSMRFEIVANITDQFDRPVKNGTATLYINDEIHTVEVKDGKAIFDQFDHPKPGEYFAYIVYGSNDYYESSSDLIYIYVDKVLTTVRGDDTHAKTGQKVDYIVFVDDEFGYPVQNGTVTLVFGDINETVNVTDGYAVFEGLIAPLPGEYTVDLYYNGNDYYYPSNSTLDVFISKLVTFMKDAEIEGYEDDIVNVTTRVYDEFGNNVMGNVSVVIDGVTYNAEIIDGYATFSNIKLTKAGDFTYEMLFEETEIYLPTNATLKVKVLPLEYHVTKVLLNDTVHVGDIIYFNMTFYNDCGGDIALLYADDLYSDGIVLYTDVAQPGWTLIDDYARYDSLFPAHSSTSIVLPFKVLKLGNWSNEMVMYVNGFNRENSTTVNFTVVPSPGIEVVKTLVNKGIIYEGDQVIFKIELINTGDVNMEEAYFIENKTIGGSLIYDHFEYNKDCWCAQDLGDKIKFILKHSLEIGEDHVIELIYNATDEGEFINTVDAGCEYDVNDSDSVKVNITSYSPSVEVTKVLVSEDAVYEGDQIAFHIVVENTGDVELDNIYFIENSYDDLVYDHFKQSNQNWTVEKLDGDRYKFTLNQEVAIGEEFGLTVYFNSTTSGWKENNVTAGYNSRGSDVDWMNATCKVEVLPRIVEIQLEKIKAETDRVITVGELAAFRVVIINKGNIALENVYFIENIPDGLVYLYANESASWTVSKISDNKYKFTYDQILLPEDMANILLIFNATSMGIKNNTVTAGYDDVELANASDYVNVTAQHIPDPEGDNYNITIEKFLITQGNIRVNDMVEYEIRVHNVGDVHIESMDLVLKEYPCDNLEYFDWDSSSPWIVDEDTLTFTLARNISVGSYASLHVFFIVTGEGYINNTVTGTWNDGKNETTAITPDKEALPYNPNITATKVLVKDKVFVGDQVVYEIVIRNTGNVPLDTIFFTENEFDEVLVYDHYTSDDSWTYSDTTNTFRLVRSLNKGDTSTIMLYYNATSAGSVANSIKAGFIGSELTNATSKNVTVVDKIYNMTVVKVSLERYGVTVGNQTRFEFKITNTGNIDLYNVFIREDNFSEGLVYDSIRSDVPWTYDESTKTFTLEKLEAGDFTTVHLIFNTTTPGVKTNNATFGYNDSVMGNAVASVEVYEIDPFVSVEKITLTNNTVMGEEVLFKVNITNLGLHSIRNLKVVENYSAGLLLIASEGTEFWSQSKDSQGRDVFTYNRLLRAGQSVVLTFKFNSTAVGILNNTVNVFVDDLQVGNATNSTRVMHLTNITAEPVEGKVGEKVNVTADIVDEKGNKVLEGTAVLVIEGSNYTAEVHDGKAVFENVVLPDAGSYVGNISYIENERYAPSNGTVDVVVSPLDTSIAAEPVVGKVGDIVTVRANVTDENGNPVLNGAATLVIDGVEYTVNVTDGKAVFEDVVLSVPGIHVVNVTYNGAKNYNPSNGTVDVAVSALDTNITVEPVEGKAGDVVNVTANVTDENGNPVLNGTAKFVIDGVEYTAEVTDGKAVFKDVVLPIPGSYTANVTYNGNGYYMPSNNTVDVNVAPLDTIISADSIEGKVSESVSIKANITDERGNPVLNGTATLSINGVNYTADILNGVVTFENVVLTNSGNFTGKITYSGDDSHNPSEATIDVAISKLDTTIEADDVVGYPGYVVDIVAIVLDENGNPVLSGIAILEIGDRIANADKSAAGEYVAEVVNGKAVFKNVALSAPGIYKGYLAYLGDDTYNPSNNTMKITVLKVSVDISVNAPSGKPGETVNVTVKVIPKDSSPFNGVVTVILPDGTIKKVTVTDGVGVVSWTIPKDFKPGTYDILVIFDGDEYYCSANATTAVDVLKDNRTSPVKNETDVSVQNNVVSQHVARYETANPIYLLVVVLTIVGLLPLRRKQN